MQGLPHAEGKDGLVDLQGFPLVVPRPPYVDFSSHALQAFASCKYHACRDEPEHPVVGHTAVALSTSPCVLFIGGKVECLSVFLCRSLRPLSRHAETKRRSDKNAVAIKYPLVAIDLDLLSTGQLR